MVQTDLLADELRRLGATRIVGVPCSYLTPLINEFSGDAKYVAASSEGEAIGIAAGAYLGGVELPCVLMQNSGLGNAINPLTSLALPYKIPMLLVIGYRNSDGHGPPQHSVMAASTEPLLSVLGIEHQILADSHSLALEQVRDLAAHAIQTGTPAALLVPKGRFSPVSAPITVDIPPSVERPAQRSLPPGRATHTRFECLRALRQALGPDDLVVSTTGLTSRELWSIDDQPNHFYMVGSMGCAAAIGLGLGLERPDRRVVIVDGDGALLMKLGSLATVGHYGPPNVVHLLLNNGTYESTGDQPTTAPSVDFCAMAEAAGAPREGAAAVLLRPRAAAPGKQQVVDSARASWYGEAVARGGFAS